MRDADSVKLNNQSDLHISEREVHGRVEAQPL